MTDSPAAGVTTSIVWPVVTDAAIPGSHSSAAGGWIGSQAVPPAGATRARTRSCRRRDRCHRARRPPMASRSGTIRRRTHTMQASDIPIHSSPWVSPRMNVSGWGLPAAKAQIRQRGVDAGVCERGPLQAGEHLRVADRRRASRHRGSSDSLLTPSASAPPAAGPRRPRRATRRFPSGHQSKASCSWSGVTSAPSGSHAWPTNITIRWGSAINASARARSGCHRPLLGELAHQRVGGALARGPPRRRRRAPSARPTRRPTARAAPPASAPRRRG